MRRALLLRRWGAALAVAALMASGCTVRQNDQYQVDLVATGYHFHLYRTTTMMIWFAHSTLCSWNPNCTLQRVKDQASVNGILGALSGVDFFFDDDGPDFDDALRSTPHPWPLSVNLPNQYGCLGGYKNTIIPRSDGDWYGDPPDRPWCLVGKPLS
jgi:hypothetical protein